MAGWHAIGRLDPATREALEVLGRVLRQLRVDRGLSQRGLAARSGLSQSSISRLECGLAEGVRVAWIARLLAGLDSRVNVLPDERPMLERHHGFRHLLHAFSQEGGEARRRLRDKRRREGLEAYAASIGHPETRNVITPLASPTTNEDDWRAQTQPEERRCRRGPDVAPRGAR